MPYQPLVISLGVGCARDGRACAGASPPGAGSDECPGGDRHRLLAIQLVSIYTPPIRHRFPSTHRWPASGRCLRGGRSVLISHHYPTPIVSNAVDFVRLDGEGRGHDGDRSRRALVRLRPAGVVAGRWHGRQRDRCPPGRARRQHRGEALDWQPHRPRHRQWALRRAGAPPQGKRSGERRENACGPASRSRPWGTRETRWCRTCTCRCRTARASVSMSVRVPMVFRNVVLIRGGRRSTPVAADLKRGDDIRRIGD